MKLSDILNKYYVIPMSHCEIVGFTINDDADDNDVNPITITWNDSDTFESYLEVFDDQDVEFLDQPTGAFTATDAEGKTAIFIALDGVNLKENN